MLKVKIKSTFSLHFSTLKEFTDKLDLLCVTFKKKYDNLHSTKTFLHLKVIRELK